jgi:puromycin-sensitive aminopeptidase
MQNFCTDRIFPDWALWDQFVANELSSALRLDSLRSSHPIQVPIRHAREVEQVFDAISYCKGACVVRMLFAYLGHDAFRKGLQMYMDKYKYSNTVTGDLWASWGAASGKPVSDVARSWTEQMGYPLLSVSLNGGKLHVEQRWFLQDGSSLNDEERQKKWRVPILLGGRGDDTRQTDYD